jgi:uncharacterized SAM-binding protein YcdF (DUF218 family)
MQFGSWLLAAWLVLMPWFHSALWLSPLYWLLCALALVVWAGRRGLRRARQLGLALAGVCLALMTPAAANTLLHWVERPLAPAACVADADRELVLLTGGTRRAAADARDVGALSQASVLRAMAFVQRFGAPDARSVTVAGGGFGVPESVLVAALLERAGLPAARLRTEQDSLTTWESARALSGQGRPAARRIVLATSALHMARSARAFRAHGFDVCESPLYSEVVDPGALPTFFPQSTALSKSERVLHEIVGGWVYGVRRAD